MAPPCTGSPGPFGPGTRGESEKSPERVGPRAGPPESRKSAKRVQNPTFGPFSDFFGTPGRTLSGLWEFRHTDRALFRDSFRTLLWFGAGPILKGAQHKRLVSATICGHLQSHLRTSDSAVCSRLRFWGCAKGAEKGSCGETVIQNAKMHCKTFSVGLPNCLISNEVLEGGCLGRGRFVFHSGNHENHGNHENEKKNIENK